MTDEKMSRICAVETHKDGTASVFQRMPDGSVVKSEMPFRPFLLTAFNAFPDELPGTV